MIVSFATRMLIAVASIAAIMAAISAALIAQGRMTSQVQLWIVIIGLIPVAVNCGGIDNMPRPLYSYWYLLSQ
jgi:hypothetical protein